MTRNRNLDIIRGITILLIVAYHVYAIANNSGYGPKTYIPVLTELLMYGGEIGVTLFFIMSGYGIYNSLHSDDKKGEIRYLSFLNRRFKRIAPQYYVSIGIMLLLTNQAGLLSVNGFKHVLTHAVFVHNWWPDTHGSISGVLWTMGTIVQFYIVAVLLYKCVKKNSVLSIVGAIFVTVGSKYVLFHIVGLNQYFIYGRQLVSALDNFVIGMLLARYDIKRQNKTGKFENKWMICFLNIIVLTVFCIFIYLTARKLNIYEDSIVGYVWHSVLAIMLMMIIHMFTKLHLNHEFIVNKVIHYIASIQYGIYIWHLIIIESLISRSAYIVAIAQRSFIALIIVFMIISIFVGGVTSGYIDGINYRSLKKEK